jgi:hypothetical protein
MVEGEQRSETKQRIHQCITIMFNELSLQYLTLEELSIIIDKKYNLPTRKQNLGGYLTQMKHYITFSAKRVKNGCGRPIAYKIDGEQDLDLNLIWPTIIQEPVKIKRSRNPKAVYEENKFNPPRSPLINKLLGLPA